MLTLGMRQSCQWTVMLLCYIWKTLIISGPADTTTTHLTELFSKRAICSHLCHLNRRCPRINLASGEAGMIYTDSDHVAISMTRHVSHHFPFVNQIHLDVAFKHNSDTHSESGADKRDVHSPGREKGVLPSVTPCLIFLGFHCFLIVRGCSLFCNSLRFTSLGSWCPFLKKKNHREYWK